MQAEIIDQWSDFDGLEGEWNPLLTGSEADNLFLTWEWIQAWRESTQENHSPFAVIVRDQQGNLIGAAPFYQSRLRLLHAVPYRVLRMMADWCTGAEYPNIIVARGAEERVYPSIIECLKHHSSRWDCMWLPNWKGWDDTFSGFLKYVAEEKALGFYHRPTDFSFLPLAESLDATFASLSKSQRYANRRVVKKISELKDISVECCNSADELPHYLQELFDLHYKRWSSVGESGSFNRRQGLVDFYRVFSAKALNEGWLRLIRLVHNGRTKAIQIGYLYNGIFHQIQEGFDPDFVQGAGNYLRTRVIEQCIGEGAAEYDFLGGYSEHKRRWGARKREGYDLFLWRKSLKNLPFSMKKVWPSGRYMTADVETGRS